MEYLLDGIDVLDDGVVKFCVGGRGFAFRLSRGSWPREIEAWILIEKDGVGPHNRYRYQSSPLVGAYAAHGEVKKGSLIVNFNVAYGCCTLDNETVDGLQSAVWNRYRSRLKK